MIRNQELGIRNVIRNQKRESGTRNQERDQELALSRGLQLACRDEQHEPLYGSDEAPIRQVPLAVLLLLLLLGPPVDAAQGGFGISLASHRWPLLQLLWLLRTLS